MNQLTKTEHTLEHKYDGQTWVQEIAGMHAESRKLASQGRIQEALELAQDEQIENYGNCRNVKFRVVTTTRTVSVLGHLSEEDQA